VRISENHLQKFLDVIPIGISVHDATGQITYANQVAKQLLNIQDLPAATREEISKAYHVYRADSDRLYPVEELPLVRSLGGFPAWADDLELHQGSRLVSLEVTTTPIYNDRGTVEYAIASFQDITLRKQAQKALVESEQRYAALAKAAPVGIFRNDLQGNCLYANDRGFEMIGVPEAEAMGTGWTKTLHPDDRDRIIAAWLNFTKQGVPFHCEYRFLRPDGTIIWVFGQAVPEKDASGNVIGYVGTITDISERKQAEEILANYHKTLEIQIAQRTAELRQTNLKLEAEIASRQQIELALRKSEEKSTTILNNVGACIYIKDLNGIYIYANSCMAELFGLSPEEMLGKDDFQFFSEEMASSIRESDRQVMESGTGLHTDQSGFVKHSGEIHYYFSVRVPLKNPDGSIIGVCGISTDITSLKKAEAALRQSEARYLGIIEDQTELIVRYLPNGTLTFVNEAYCRFLGVKREEIIGNHYSPIIFEEDREYVQKEVNSINEQNPIVTIENRVIVGGELRWMQWINRGIFDNNGQIVKYQAVGRDISAHKRVEETLKASEHFLQKVTHAVPQVLYLFDISQGTTIYLNRQCDAVLGYSPEEIYQASPEWLINCLHPNDRHLYYNINSRFTKLTDNEVLATEYRFRHKNGEWRWMNAREVVFARDANGVPKQILGAVQDISERKMTEVLLAQAKETAVAANKAKSVFLANMSHELRTPLNVILGFSRLMRNDTNFSEEQQENLDIICRSGEHLLSLINQVLELSKIEAGRQTLNESNFDLYYLLALLEDIFSLKAKDKGLLLTFEREPNVPQYIRTDEAKLRQVLINLLNNAIKFTKAGSVSLKVAMENRKLGMNNQSQLIPENSSILLVSNPRIIFEVSDTGFGIAPEEFDKLFKPFLQTASSEQVQEGTGLGLTISCQFIHLMGGEITVSSHGQVFTPSEKKLNVTSFNESQKGTTFKINIPVGICNENEIEKPPQNRRVIGLAPHQPSYRILIVDDNDYNRKLLVKILTNIGFEIREASNGAEAIEIWQSWEPHLIWMDMRMPVMDGYEATKRIKATTKGQATAVIAITASAWEEEKTVILSAGCDDFVRKPFQEQTIFDLMAKYLGISYIYELPELDSRPDNVAEEPLNLTSILAIMSKKWIIKLHEAAFDADSELVSKLLEKIPSSYVLELQILRAWVKKFQFEKILDLTELFLQK
jgi:PAS domain S-box-containing protein